MKFVIPVLVIGLILGIIILALTIATLVKVNKKITDTQNDGSISPIDTTTLLPSSNSALGASIGFKEVMSYLNELQLIANDANGTRAINTAGFNRTLDYIYNYLTANTNYNVTKVFFNVTSTTLARNPILISSMNGTITNHTYSTNASLADFYYVEYTASANRTNFVELTVIPNVGCTDEDWRNASPSSINRIALVKRGDCTFVEKGVLAMKYNVSGLLIYNDGTEANRTAPLFITLGSNNTLPALFLSFDLGQKLAVAAQNTSGNVSILINIIRSIDSPSPVGNICADTPTGDITQTIVIGSHSDSVPAGPGINDNGKSVN
jgi:Zn-dependent M28 family amino/carboxypeptidase